MSPCSYLTDFKFELLPVMNVMRDIDIEIHNHYTRTIESFPPPVTSELSNAEYSIIFQ